MVNKKGYIRTLEAVIAIILILIFIFSVLPKKQTEELKTPREIDLTSDRILNEVQNNEEFRGCVIDDLDPSSLLLGQKSAEQCINTFITDNNLIPQTLDYKVKVCDTSITDTTAYNFCGEPPLVGTEDKTVYVKSIILSGTLTELKTKRVKLYIWRKV